MNSRGSSAHGLILLLPVVLLIAEVAVFIWVWQLMGWWTLLLALATSAVGALLIPTISREAWHNLQAMARTRTVKTTTGTSGIRMMGALLLFAPGFITDVTGAVLQIPPVANAIARRASEKVSATVVSSRPFGTHPVVEGEVVQPTTGEGSTVVEGTILMPPEERKD